MDNKGEIGADQDIVPELKEYITQFPARVITWSHDDGGRITAEMKMSISGKKRKLIVIIKIKGRETISILEF